MLKRKLHDWDRMTNEEFGDIVIAVLVIGACAALGLYIGWAGS